MKQFNETRFDVTSPPYFANYKGEFHLFTEYFDKRSWEKEIWHRTMQCEPCDPWFDHVNLSKAKIVNAHKLQIGHVLFFFCV